MKRQDFVTLSLKKPAVCRLSTTLPRQTQREAEMKTQKETCEESWRKMKWVIEHVGVGRKAIE